MKKLTDDVWQLSGWPPDMVNVYLIGDVLIDAGTRFDCGRILRELDGRGVAAHALTHAHPDHLGSSHAVCERLGIPFWVSNADAPAAEDMRRLAATLHDDGVAARLAAPLIRAYVASQAGSGHPVSRKLREGDDVGGFTVLETPGHTAGHIAFWRQADRVLIAGDVLWNFQFVAGRPGLSEPVAVANFDSAANRESARRLARLEPSLICFGHGPPLRDGHAFASYVERLASR